MYGSERSGIFPVVSLIYFLAGFLHAQSILGKAADWQAAPDSPAVLQQENAVIFPCSFKQEADRHYWDCSLTEDWHRQDGLRVEYRLENPGACRAVTLYLKSGGGWLTAYLPLKAGYQSVFLPFRDFEAEDDPAGLQDIKGLRISPWKGDGGGGELHLFKIEPIQTRILCVDPDTGTSLNPAEQAFGVERSGWLADQFELLGFPASRLTDTEAAATDLQKYDWVVLPYNAYPSEALLKALQNYLRQGGKLLVFYSASPELARMCGFKLQRYLNADSDEKWHVISFSDPRWPGPVSVKMPARNIMPVLPDGNAKVLAHWQDAAGRMQKEPAVLISDQAVWFTSVIDPGDAQTQRQMLAALGKRLLPDLKMPESAVLQQLESLRHREQYIRNPAAYSQQVGNISHFVKTEQPFQAWKALDHLQTELDEAAAEAFETPRFAMRGIWDHTGRGLDNGNWASTVDLLVSSGITDLFVNIPRESSNPIRVIRAAKGRVAVHAWYICWNLTGVSPVMLRRFEREGRLQITASGETMPWLCPTNSENVSSELRRLETLSKTEGLRGIHLDYIRWQDNQPCACDNCRKAFAAHIHQRADLAIGSPGGGAT